VEAELTLAELYIRGEGVPKNCGQARVLLSAAAKKGNQTASEELAQLVRNGCR
jgi:TPR repeat protein